MIFSDLLSRRILVVEDDYMHASEMTLALERQGSDVVGPFPGLHDGLRAVERAGIDAAVLDVRLGEDDVYQLADILKSRRVPFMFVTGYDRANIPHRFADVRYLPKPYDSDAMVIMLAITLAEHRRLH